ncbi:hypothetical protein HY029_05420 [Candidatus Gottesmanbacteria bacterium]|nr:hypothetical protein [Candidatus Gottesmanbacteria bacterium]
MHREKITFFKILFTVGLLVSLPVTIILTNSPKQNQDVRSKAATPNIQPPTRIMFVPFSFTKDNNGKIRFRFENNPQIRNGFPPLPQTTAGPQFTATVFSDTGQRGWSQKFTLPQLVAIDGIDATSKKERAEFKEVSGDNFGLTLPYDTDTDFLEIKDPKGVIINMVSLKNTLSEDNPTYYKEIKGDDFDIKGNDDKNKSLFYKINPLSAKEVFAANGTLNIAIIGDNYNGDNLHFQADASDIAAGFISIEPFKSYKSSIIFYTQLSTVPICTFTTSLSCNDTTALHQASSLPYDKVYVLYNGHYSGYAYVGATLAYGTNSTDKSKAVKQGLFIHELAGHVLGGLMDEYSYGITGISYGPNCSDSSSCPSWSSIAGLGCFSTCGYTNLYRATDNSSVMNSALFSGVLTFDPFSTQIVQGKLLSYFTIIPPTPTLPPPTPTPTATPTPSLTPTLTPTVTPTIIPTTNPRNPGIFSPATFGDQLTTTPTITPSPTPTPIPTSTPTFTPTPTQPPRCSFPNFCTGPDFCETENILQLNCDSSAVVCCKVQIPEGNSNLSTQGNITPTQAQKFDPLPTTPMVYTERSGNLPTQTLNIPTPTITSLPNAIITSNQTTQVQQQTTLPTNIPQEVSLNTTINILNPNSIPPTVSLPKPTIDDNYPIYTPPSPTTYQVENIIFERATPTPQPRLGFLDILSAPSRFANAIIKNFFSIFSGD